MSRRAPDGWYRPKNDSGKSENAFERKDHAWRISAAKIKDEWAFTLWKRINGDWALKGNFDSVKAAIAAAWRMR